MNTLKDSAQAKPLNCKTSIIKATEHHDKNKNQAYKVFTWNEISVGDCLMQSGSTLTIFQDGSYIFKAKLRSSDTGDEWDYSFDILDVNGGVLVHFPHGNQYTIFDIHDANVWKDCNDARQPHDTTAHIFPSIAGAIMHSSC